MEINYKEVLCRLGTYRVNGEDKPTLYYIASHDDQTMYKAGFEELHYDLWGKVLTDGEYKEITKREEGRQMDNVFIEYCIDGHNIIKNEVKDIQKEFNNIKTQVENIFDAPFGVDVVIKGVGRMSIGLSEHTILSYKTEDLEIQLTAVGNIDSVGNIQFYFGEYTTMSNKYLIPYELGIKIINDWITTKELPKQVEWTDKIF